MVSDQRRSTSEERGREDTGKSMNMCFTDEITKLQMKEMSNDKEVNGISKKKLWKASKQKKKKKNQVK